MTTTSRDDASATPSSPVPSVARQSRRRDVGSGSARSLLLTLLGEFVHPRGEKVWTATLVEALGALGVEEKAARQALTRTASEGILTSTRHGRRVLWDVTESGKALLTPGSQRIYGFMRERRTWNGRWLVLTVAIPETQRQLRHRLRTRLTWLGLGSPTSGLWITPDETKEPEVHAVIRDLGLDRQAFAWTGPATGIGDETQLIQQAWDLDEVEGRYLDFLTDFEELRAESPREAFVAQVRMVQEWRRFPFLDPDLPSELLDHDWPGSRAAAVFHDRHARWHRHAQSEWDRMDLAGGEKP